MTKGLKKFAKGALTAGALFATTAGAANAQSADMFTPTPQSPNAGRVVNVGPRIEYCQNIGGREMWVGGNTIQIVGADNQIWQVNRAMQAFPNRPTYDCSTFGQINNILPKVLRKIPRYNGVGISGPTNSY